MLIRVIAMLPNKCLHSLLKFKKQTAISRRLNAVISDFDAIGRVVSLPPFSC